MTKRRRPHPTDSVLVLRSIIVYLPRKCVSCVKMDGMCRGARRGILSRGRIQSDLLPINIYRMMLLSSLVRRRGEHDKRMASMQLHRDYKWRRQASARGGWTGFLSLALAALLAASVLAGCSLNRRPPLDELDRYVAAAHQIWDFHGTVLVAKEGEILLAKGYGWADREFNQKNTPRTRFFISSITKQFTATAILQLKEQGRLSLDDPVTKYLPDYPAETGDRITIGQLLSHTAGVPNYTEAPEVLINRTKKLSPQTLLAVFKDRPLDFDPGTDFHYSNSGYILLGAIIEKVSGQSYEA
ncbi:serine hydrolase, partial [candidate division GN15 bacterium]|nr:serine hydrolase [candidate division GN15 bacterium]